MAKMTLGWTRSSGRIVQALVAWSLGLLIGGTAWAQTPQCAQTPIFAENASTGGYLSSDCSLDGNGSLAIIGEIRGVHPDQPIGWDSVGKALIYHRPIGTSDHWEEVEEILQPDPAIGDFFGSSVAVSGRFAIISAKGRDDGKGAIYFFERDVLAPVGSQWSLFQPQIPNPSGVEDGFGGVSSTRNEFVAIDGSIAVVGAVFASDEYDTVRSGRVYVYVFDVLLSQWVHEATLKPPAGDIDQPCLFGFSVEMSGNRVIVGAPNFDSESGPGTEGKAYIFTRTGTGSSAWSLEGQLLASSTDPSEGLGWSVSIDGNAALAGAPFSEVGTNSNVGKTYVFAYSSSTHLWSQYGSALTPSDAASGQSFGIAVALSGTLALAGSPDANSQIGRSYLFQRAIGGWSEVLILGSAEGVSLDSTGSTLALKSTVAVVGALGDEESSQALQAGSVMFFGGLPEPECEE